MDEKRLLIVCEGQTEKNYLSQWTQHCGVTGDKIDIICGAHQEPMLLLEQAVKEYSWSVQSKERLYTDVWLVFDRDSHQTFHQTLGMQQKFPYVRLCWTNPCIEFWFLMHFAPFPPFKRSKALVLNREDCVLPNSALKTSTETIEMIVDPKDVAEQLSYMWHDYKKGCAAYVRTLKNHMDDAIAQCIKTDLHQDCFAFGSLMPELLTAIAELATGNRDDAEKMVSKKWHEYCEMQRRIKQLHGNPLP